MDDRAMVVVLEEEEEEEEEEERVCMQVLCRDYGKDFRSDVETYKWYVDVIDHHAAAAASNAVEIQGMCRPFYKFTGSASSNSTVYVFGGHHFHSIYSPIPNNTTLDDPDSPFRFEVVDPLVSDVWYNDTFIKKGDDDDDDIYASYASGGWIKGASMLHSRITPRTISMEEKIYVFGGVSSLTPATWAEVYEIKSNSWSSLPPPPANLLTDNIRNEPLYVYKCAALDKFMILVYFLGPALYSYDVKLGTWELFDATFGSIEHDLAVVSCRCDTTTTTPVLLTVKEDDGKLYGYHLGQKKWFDSPVNVDGQDNAIPHPDLEGFIRSFHLIPMGRNHDKLCYLWSYYPGDHSGLWVHCTKLSFYYDGHSSSLSAKVESTNLFKLRHVDNLHSCVPLVTRCRGTKRAGVSLCTEKEEEEKKNKHSPAMSISI